MWPRSVCVELLCTSGDVVANAQAPHVHFLLLEISSILGLQVLPKVYIEAGRGPPSVHFLCLPTALTDSVQQPEQPIGAVHPGAMTAGFTWRRQALLVVTGSTLELAPGQLQAALGAALTAMHPSLGKAYVGCMASVICMMHLSCATCLQMTSLPWHALVQQALTGYLRGPACELYIKPAAGLLEPALLLRGSSLT